MKFSTTPLRRRIAGGVAAALVAGSAATLVAAPAQAATPSLDWNISEQFVRHLWLSQAGPTLPTTPVGTVTGGASYVQGDPAVSSDDYFSFTPKDTLTAADGTKVYRYSGTVNGSFVVGGNAFYTVKVADPVVSVAADGTGSINATVSGTVPGDNLATPDTLVKVADLSGATAAGEGFTATPAWAGVLAADSAQATELGIKAGVPLQGQSFNPDFLEALPVSVRAHFYASGASADRYKGVGTPRFAAPATVLAPSVTSKVAKANAEDGLSITVSGKGFSAATLPGDAGVYVALVPAGTVIDYANRASLAGIPAVDYVLPQRFNGDAFNAVLNVNPEKVVKGTRYEIVTWQAHTHSNATQDTRTAVAVDWSKYDVGTLAPPLTPKKKATKTTTKVAKKATRKKAGKLTVAVKAGRTKATGKVTLTIQAPGKKAVKKVAKLKKGKVTVTLPKAKKKGTYKVTVAYKGAAKFKAAKKKVVKFKVK